MRLTAIELYTKDYSQVVKFGLDGESYHDHYMVRSITGLDADNLTPRFYGVGLNTVPKFYDFSLPPRDIILRVALKPKFNLGQSYADLRDDLYRAISASRVGQVELHFKAANSVVGRLFGFITKFEAGYFNKLPEVQLTIHCDDPIFRGISPVIYKSVDISEVNPVIIADSLSTAPHGFTVNITYVSDTASLNIQDAFDPEWKFTVTPPGGLLTGDVLYFSSEFTNKYLYVIRGGNTIHLLDTIEPGSIWPTIFPGANNFYFPEIDSFGWGNLEYYAAYWGV